MKKTTRRVGVNLGELDRVLDGARQATLSEPDHGKRQRRAACSGGNAGAASQQREDQAGQKKPKALVRVIGQAPLKATV
jgi:hypothetical protein